MNTLISFLNPFNRAEKTSYSIYDVFESEEVKSREFIKLTLSGSLFSLSRFENVTFSGCVFYASRIENCEFKNCQFIDCEFHFSSIEHSKFISCIFENNFWELCPIKKNKFVDVYLDFKTHHFVTKERPSNTLESCFIEELPDSEGLESVATDWAQGEGEELFSLPPLPLLPSEEEGATATLCLRNIKLAA